MPTLLIYGANGYSGRMIVAASLARGIRPIVAGRNAAQVAAVGKELGLEHRAFDLGDTTALDQGLAGVTVVLHCAGPFSATARPMLEACIRHHVHYLDITGEFHVIEDVAKHDAELRAAGVMAMSGTGMDVVPSDCLVAHMKLRMPDAIKLELYIRALEKLSPGTATSFVENMGLPNVVRENGLLIEKVAGADRRVVEFNGKRVSLVGLPWGDISSGWRTTGIPNISVFMSLMPGAAPMIRLGGLFRGILQLPSVQNFFKRMALRWLPGPSQDYCASESAEFIAKASNAAGQQCLSYLITKEGYALTAEVASAIALRVLNGAAEPGFQTPGKLFGPDFILEFDDSHREDLDQAPCPATFDTPATPHTHQ